MTHFTSPLWVVDPDNVGKTDPTSPAVMIGTDGVTSYSGGNPVFSGRITVSLTTAQILGMFAAPVAILPAPGVGQFILVTSFIYENIFNTTAFQAGGAVTLNYTTSTTAASAALSAANTALQAASSVIAGVGIATVLPTGANANQGITIQNATQAFTTGDGSAKITVVYTILTL